MAYLPCDKCGKITTHQGSWSTPVIILCNRCSKPKIEIQTGIGKGIKHY